MKSPAHGIFHLMVMIPEKVIQQILDKASLVELVGSERLKGKGAIYKGCCPFHNERTPSFKVDESKGLFYCFGCGKGGNAINYVMEDKRLTYQGAVKWLAGQLNIEYKDKPESDSEKEARLKRESLMGLMARVSAFYVELFNASREPQAYAFRRWGEQFCREYGMGYAPESGHALVDWAKMQGENMAQLKELGLIRERDDGSLYDFYRARVMIPITDRFGNILSFTARDLTGKKDVAKYLNGSETPIFVKGRTLFGIQGAWRQASKEEKVYAVEGAPDCLRMQIIGVNNTVAPMGTSWTEAQFAILKRVAHKICFLPDSDPPKQGETFGAGVNAVIRNGKEAVKLGFAVTVRQIPLGEHGTKQDPDEYCKDMAQFRGLEEREFILWLAGLRFEHADSVADRSAAVTEIAGLLAYIEDETMVSFLLEEICVISQSKERYWKEAINRQRKGLEEKKREKSQKTEIDLLARYGFYVRDNCYYSTTKDGDPLQWTNFTMTPLFHIRDNVMAKRTFKLKGENGQEVMLELKQDELVALAKFRQRVEAQGNFLFMAGDRELMKLKLFLYEETETAFEIKQLGWQSQGFYAWGNGIWDGSTFHHVDEMGIVRLEEKGNFYLPAFSQQYINDKQLYKFERGFAHYGNSKVPLRDFTEQLFKVFGENGKVGFCFLLATLFRDVVTAETRFFPILNLFGPKGSGKSELGHTLMSFFIIGNVPPNINNASVPAMNDTIAQVVNALVHIDEYKNDIEPYKREFLKGIWDGTGRTRMNMDLDKRKETTAVNSGLILSGQEMPTADIALFSRLIFLTFGKSDFTMDEKKEYQRLYEMRSIGVSHLTLQLLGHRKKMEVDFRENYLQTHKEVVDILAGENIEDRIMNNWIVPLAVFRTLEDSINVGLSYAEVRRIAVDGIRRQNTECNSYNEVAGFWSTVQYLLANREIQYDGDFTIAYQLSLKTDIVDIHWREACPVLFLQKSRIFMMYKRLGKQVGDTTLSEGALKYYLMNSKAYLGEKVKRFSLFAKDGSPIYEQQEAAVGCRPRQKTTTQRAFCFDYRYLKEHYNIELMENPVFDQTEEED